MEYLDLLLKSKLIPRDLLIGLCNEYVKVGSGQSLSIERLRCLLMGHGLLTDWQHQKLLQRRIKGFYINRFKILSRNRRSSGTVAFIAEERSTNNLFELKILCPSLVKDRVRLERFKKELKTQALQHPNITKVYALECCNVSGIGNLHFLVGEYENSQSIFELVQDRGPLSFNLVVEILTQVTDALVYTHANRIVHRNLKPQNLLINQNRIVKITNWSIARFLDESVADSITMLNHQSLLGTLVCMAPEQFIDPHHIDETADLYSIGAIMHYMLTGKFPLHVPTGGIQSLTSLICSSALPLQSKRSDIPQELSMICERLLSKNKRRRFQSAHELKETFSGLKLQIGTENLFQLHSEEATVTFGLEQNPSS